MTRSWKQSLLAGVLVLASSAAPALACGPTRCTAPIQQTNVASDSTYADASQTDPTQTDATQPGSVIPAQGVASDGAAGDQVANDLPADAKRAIRLAAAKAGKTSDAGQTESVAKPTVVTSAPVPAPAVARQASTRRVAPVAATAPVAARASNLSFNARMAQVFSVEQNLAGQTARLEAKLAELARWDSAAQEKFRRAFGTVDESARQRVAKAIAKQIIKNRQTLAALGEGVNLEFYLQSKRN